ncbi:F0F1 ATP synthase subunit I [Oceanospirillum sediminis]|uniref:F0F1 ATP synthase subunit I n=1 Tax=Oceanospirillum sediminis TaxID=2760088 RepID=A0A839IS95_9GAMM|nr:F0F1 ATP synthase subunit I [Oceanospirillum sediminis]MBB1488343.1 F0F1 ATP synthase subunit I [Oceanospirillum sediminis]
MGARSAQLKRPKVFRIVGLQALVTLLISAGCFLLADGVSAYSALLGGVVCFMPNLYFAWAAFRHQGAQMAKQIVKSFYKAEAVKFGLTAVLFALVFALVRPLNPIYFFLTYAVVQVVHWLSPLVIKR